MAQKRRVAHDELRRRPLRFRRIVGVAQVQYRVGLADGVQRRQDGPLRVREPVGLVPLDVADPQRRPRQFRRVVVDLQPQHLVRLHPRRQPQPPLRRRVVDDLLLQVQQRPQRDVQEVAAAARRVQHLHRRQPLPERLQAGAGPGTI